jgi:hypothetical protein
MKLLKNNCGAADILTVCLVMILSIVGITILGINLRMGKHEKYIIDDAVVTASTSCQVTDLYHYATSEELVLDAGEEGAYDNSMEEGTRKALEIAYERFTSCLTESIGLKKTLEPDRNTYIKSVKINEFTIYNVTDEGIYKCSYSSDLGYQNAIRENTGITIETKNTTMEIVHTSVYVDAIFQVEIYGSNYDIPIKEYVYSN